MTDSILTTVKKNLGLADEYTAFDPDVIMHINTAFTTLADIGLGPSDGFMIEDKTPVWADFLGTDKRLNSVKSYVYLRVRLLFDPPTTGYLKDSMEKQLDEILYRLSYYRESRDHPYVIPVDQINSGDLIVDGGEL